MVLKRYELSELMLVPNPVLNTLSKYIGSYVSETFLFCDLRSVLKKLSSKSILEILVSMIASFYKDITLFKKLGGMLFEKPVSILI